MPDKDQIVQQLVAQTCEISDADGESPDRAHFDLAKKRTLDAAGDDVERALIRAISWPDVEHLV